MDGQGRIRFGYKGDGEQLEWHVIHLTTYSAPPEYLSFLRDQRIPYLLAGEGRVDLAESLAKLGQKLGVRTVMTGSGGKLGGALVRAGLVDEIYVSFHPVVVGGFQTPTLFSSPDVNPPDILPTRLTLLAAEVLANGVVTLRYRVLPEG